jgi:hypothetical protein
VALNVARTAKIGTTRRRAHERQAILMPQPQDADEGACRDWQPLLHEEIDRLPEKYRAPVVLCYLEGKTHDEAARQLGWPLGTVKGRLARAREVLRTRLTGRGLALSVGALAVTLTLAAAAAVPPAVKLLEKLDQWILSGDTLRTWRALEVLEQVGTPEARQVLEKLAQGAPGTRPTEEARAALQRLARRQTK